MREKQRYKLYCTIFIILCLVPLLGLLFVGPAHPAANEVLPDVPAIVQEDGQGNLHYLEELSDYLDHRFAFRQEMITASRTVHATLLRDSTEEKVILGRDGWLFYADTLNSYEGVNGMTEREIWCAAHILSMIQNYCEQQGVTFRFTVAPNKNSLYGQYMPDRYPVRSGPSELDLLVSAMQEEGVNYIDLFSPIQKQDEILFRMQDSHWTSRGAGLAGDTILESLNCPFVPFYGESYETVWEECGDLYEMLYPTGTKLDRDEKFSRAFTFSYSQPIRTAEDAVIRTENAGALGCLLMFRDSFGNALHPYLAEAFGKAVFCRQNPYQLSQIAAEQADTVVIELVERNLRWLIEKPAVFPAPVVNLPVKSESSSNWSVRMHIESEDVLPGYVAVTGEMISVEPDETSPVFLCFGSEQYEAMPTGETSFVAYIPETMIDSLDGAEMYCGERLQKSSEIYFENDNNGGMYDE